MSDPLAGVPCGARGTRQETAPEITWVNHASFVLSMGGTKLLVDPWFSGRIFDSGWDLLAPSVHDPADLSDVTHVWISHEHPDHFHPASLRALLEACPSPPTVLFQSTVDRRVVRWCSAAGFRVMELDPLIWTELGPSFSISTSPFAIVDSWAAIRLGERTILNLNDCAIREPVELARVKDHVDEIDVLVTQFGPASWLGNPEDEVGRAARSGLQLERLGEQVRALQPTWVIPAASFVWFAHEDNSYLNENSVQVCEAVREISGASASPIVLRPGDSWKLGTANDSRRGEQFYSRQMAGIGERTLSVSESVAVVELSSLAADMSARNRERNSVLVMKILERLDPRRLGPITVWLWDHEATVEFRPSGGLRMVDKGRDEADASMHSSSLAYVLRHDWGLDTLMVNGRFRTRSGDTSALMSAFWLGPWNSAGHRLGFAMVTAAAWNRRPRLRSASSSTRG